MASLVLDTARSLIRRHDHSGFTDAEKAEILIDPYDESPKYSKTIVGIFCGVILLLGIGNALSTFIRSRYGGRVARSKTYRRTLAYYRWIATAQPKAIGWIHFPTTGTIVLIGLFWLFIFLWTFSQYPYYHSRWNVGSPPLAIRTGMMALACFPFILAFGAKVNFIGFIVGCSHEKLQVYHQWISHLFLILSLLHTFPFVYQGLKEVRPNTDGLNPMGFSQLRYSWEVAHKVYYWSGTAALIPLAWLCWGSFTPIRNHSYEIFKLLHIISAILFSGFFFIHCNELLTSWRYIEAAAGVYLASVALRFGFMLVRNGRHISKGHVEVLADNAVRVTIHLPQGSWSWRAGQHFFVNFVKVLPFESHPYTVSNAPYNDPSSIATPDRLVLLFRISPARGLGPRLLKLAASSNPTTPVLLDGPYGGLVNRDLGRHDTVVLIAGGAGATFATAVLEELVGRVLREDEGVKGLKKIEVHWAVKNEGAPLRPRVLAYLTDWDCLLPLAEAKTWFDEQLSTVLGHILKTRKSLLSLNLYVTGDGVSPAPTNITSLEYSVTTHEVDALASQKKEGSFSSSAAAIPWTVHHSRPDLPVLLSTVFTSAPSGSSIGIGSCGPVSLTTAVRRSVATMQKEIARGRSEVGEVELVVEEFDW
ncbi:hypothetical protein JCM8547_004809 [Rhodosporidiobolus lusitaniae]